MIGPLVSLDAEIDGTCDSQWGANKCPNRAEFILRNSDNLGFALMCGPHKEGYLEQFGGVGFDVLPFDPEVVRGLIERAKAGGLN